MATGLVYVAVFGAGSIAGMVLLGLIGFILVLGLLLGMVGLDLTTAIPRYTFGSIDLEDGLSFVIVIIGLFGLAELLNNLALGAERPTVTYRVRWRDLVPNWDDIRISITPTLRGTTLGCALGILPGAGAAISSFAAYAVEKRVAKHPDRFGKGAMEGVTAPEAANNAAAQTAFTALLLGLGFLLLLVALQAPLVAAFGVVTNLLATGAAFGVGKLIFQDGRLEGLLGYESQGGLESTQPLLLFAVAFGLSTDYGVFLLSRIKEARDSGASDSEALAVGLERTGRIVTAAALLFSIAIGAFVTSEVIFIKEVGLGTALAVLIDATIIRALLVPSLMALLGRWNWWAPRPLRRLHSRLGLSGA